MIVVCDINEIWRRKPFVALAKKADVLGVAPADWMVARKHGFCPSEGALNVLQVLLPPSWASRLAWFGQRLLWKRIQKQCSERNAEIDVLIVTSPHYLPLLDIIPADIQTVYYASDDYRSYEGWGQVAEQEKRMMEKVDHAFFVSDGLMERARDEYGVAPEKLSVSMNGTEARFVFNGTAPVAPPEGQLSRPIAGVVGGINDRLEFELLYQCAEHPDLGTLVLVGPIPAQPSAALARLLDHPKCVSVGRQSHDTIHKWFQCLDVGLIPYVSTEFNRMCSPMRLFDHLASGSPIVATAACDQVKYFKDGVTVCSDTDEFIQALEKQLSSPRMKRTGILWENRAEAMLKIIMELSRA